ncbi:MAG TPA: alkaline phosphatase family protein [Actinomycetota bacterium]|nr:alkaline phosphatase family protein [Actinomycetota bacterium]
MRHKGITRIAIVATAALVAVAGGQIVLDRILGRPAAPSFRDQICGLPPAWLELIRRGYHPDRAGQISLLPHHPMYMTTGSGGWTHSGPWDHLQQIPLVFYAPGRVPAGVEPTGEVTVADVAPTLAAMLGVERHAGDRDPGAARDGRVLTEVVADAPPPKLVVVVVWDGGGWNGLEQWPDAWPVLARLMSDGVSYRSAIVGSSPSVTPAVHTTLGTGVFPATHGITGVPIRDEHGVVTDAFVDGKSSRFVEVETLAERWDRRNGGRPEVAMVGYEPWHLGMIGKGAETPGADRDDAVWINRRTNRWNTFGAHYAMPRAFRNQQGLDALLEELDGTDGAVDGSWLRVPLDVRSRVEETPAFIEHHGAKLTEMIRREGYGRDRVTDLIFTNFKQIDRVAHYYNMAAPEVEQVMRASDTALGRLVDDLDRTVGQGDYVVVVTADHGMQPDVSELDSYEIDPNELERDLSAEFGPVVRAVWPTEVFLLDDELAARDVTVEEIARFIGSYTLGDNSDVEPAKVVGSGDFSAADRLFDLAVPARLLDEVSC